MWVAEVTTWQCTWYSCCLFILCSCHSLINSYAVSVFSAGLVTSNVKVTDTSTGDLVFRNLCHIKVGNNEVWSVFSHVWLSILRLPYQATLLLSSFRFTLMFFIIILKWFFGSSFYLFCYLRGWGKSFFCLDISSTK